MPNQRKINSKRDGFSTSENINVSLKALRETIRNIELKDDSNIPENIGDVKRDFLEKANSSVLNFRNGEHLTVLGRMLCDITDDPDILEIHNSLLAGGLLARACGIEGMYSYLYKQSFIVIEKLVTARLHSVGHSEKRRTTTLEDARKRAEEIWNDSPELRLNQVSKRIAEEMCLSDTTIKPYISNLNPHKGKKGRPKKGR